MQDGGHDSCKLSPLYHTNTWFKLRGSGESSQRLARPQGRGQEPPPCGLWASRPTPTTLAAVAAAEAEAGAAAAANSVIISDN